MGLVQIPGAAMNAGIKTFKYGCFQANKVLNTAMSGGSKRTRKYRKKRKYKKKKQRKYGRTKKSTKRKYTFRRTKRKWGRSKK